MNIYKLISIIKNLLKKNLSSIFNKKFFYFYYYNLYFISNFFNIFKKLTYKIKNKK